MNSDQAAALRAEFASAQIGKLPKAGIQLDYVGHAAVTDRLLQVDPEWTWEPFALGADGGPLVRDDGKTATMWIRLSVCGVTRPGVGSVLSGANEREKQLVGDALRNAAMRFGVALDLWSKEDLHDAEDNLNQPEPIGVVVPADAEWLGNRLENIGKSQGGYPQAWLDAKLPSLKNIAMLPADRLDEAVKILDRAEVEAATK